MHGEEEKYVHDAFSFNWITTAGKNVDEAERLIASCVGTKYAVGLASGTAALHMCVRLAASSLYPGRKPTEGKLAGVRVFCSDTTFDATVNPIVYEGGQPVFIDSEYETWNMDPKALEKAFEMYPEVKMVVVVNLYGTPAKLDEIRCICHSHNALLIEDAAESLGAKYKSFQTGTFGDYTAISFNGNKIITGSTGGAFLTNNLSDAEKVRKWSTQSREAAPWYQHEELGYNYRMSNLVAGVIRGQIKHLNEHIGRKREIYEHYKKEFRDIPVTMNPYIAVDMQPNHWLSCIIIDGSAMCRQVRSDREALFIPAHGKSCPTEIFETLARFNIEARPIWKPMHLQSLYMGCDYITSEGSGRGRTDAYIKKDEEMDVGTDIFNRGLCLPSDIKMTREQQDMVIEIIKRCFG